MSFNLYIRLRDVRSDNAGRYVCTATNTVGRARDYVILTVRGDLFDLKSVSSFSYFLSFFSSVYMIYTITFP